MKPRITNLGLAAQLNAMDGTGIKFKRLKLGNGTKPANYRALNDLQNPLVNVPFDTYRVLDQYVLLQGTYSNAELENAFEWTEVGIFIVDPLDEMGEILYAYGHVGLEEEEETAATIPKMGKELYEIKLTYNVFIGEAGGEITIVNESFLYAKQADFLAHVNDHNNPHVVTKAQVGLGNVDNVSTNNATPTIEMASTLTNITNGDTMKTIMGKISKALNDLIAHLKDTVKHITAEERADWNSKAAGYHKHSTNDITSGTFSIARGGTGVSTEAQLRDLIRSMLGTNGVLGIANGGTGVSTEAELSELIKSLLGTGGVLGVENGGTGVSSYLELAKKLPSMTTYVTATMTASSWSNKQYNFESIYNNVHYNIEVSLAPTATAAQQEAFSAARMVGSNNTNIVTATGTVPTINIPVILEVTEV